MSLKELGGKILCLIGEHALTSWAEEGTKPTAQELLPENVIESFAEFCALRCKRKGCRWKYRGNL